LIKDTGIGESRFLWGTTNPQGDLTSWPQRRIHWPERFLGNFDLVYRMLVFAGNCEWQAGEFHMVRFTLAGDDFMTLDEAARSANWKPEAVAEMIEFDQKTYGEYGHKDWRLRRKPLPLSRVLRVETTSYEDRETERWHPLDVTKVLLRPNDPKRKGVKIAGRTFYSVPVGPPDHQNYEPWKTPAMRAAAALERRMDDDFCRRLEEQERIDE